MLVPLASLACQTEPQLTLGNHVPVAIKSQGVSTVPIFTHAVLHRTLDWPLLLYA
jgi:hypothetical protein